MKNINRFTMENFYFSNNEVIESSESIEISLIETNVFQINNIYMINNKISDKMIFKHNTPSILLETFFNENYIKNVYLEKNM